MCRNCGRAFEKKDGKFCNDECRDAYILKLEQSVKEAVEKDPIHTQKLSRDF